MSRLLEELLYEFVPKEAVVRLQKPYVRLFQDHGAKRVLDLGCGRGIFLELLQTAGIQGAGVDSNPTVVENCRQLGFEVHQTDVLSFLEQATSNPSPSLYDGIFCSHVIEHLSGLEGVRLFEMCTRLLAPGGRLVIITPNVNNPKVWRHGFWLDPTHQRPYPRALLEAMGTRLGLTIALSIDDPATRPRWRWRRAIRYVSDLITYGFGARLGVDAVVVFDKSKEQP